MRKAAFAVAVVLALCASTARAQQPAPVDERDKQIERLRSQWDAMIVASIALAKEKGTTPAEHGAALGRLFAPSWPADMTPQRMARGVAGNLKLLGWSSTLTEDTPEAATIRYPVTATDKDFGVSAADFDATFAAVGKAIAAAHALVWEESRDGSFWVARITRKAK